MKIYNKVNELHVCKSSYKNDYLLDNLYLVSEVFDNDYNYYEYFISDMFNNSIGSIGSYHFKMHFMQCNEIKELDELFNNIMDGRVH